MLTAIAGESVQTLRLFFELPIFGERFFALVWEHSIEHQYPVEVIDLVLEQPREQFVGLNFDNIAVE